jgi:hypothetical protein
MSMFASCLPCLRASLRHYYITCSNSVVDLPVTVEINRQFAWGRGTEPQSVRKSNLLSAVCSWIVGGMWRGGWIWGCTKLPYKVYYIRKKNIDLHDVKYVSWNCTFFVWNMNWLMFCNLSDERMRVLASCCQELKLISCRPTYSWPLPSPPQVLKYRWEQTQAPSRQNALAAWVPACYIIFRTFLTKLCYIFDYFKC